MRASAWFTYICFAFELFSSFPLFLPFFFFLFFGLPFHWVFYLLVKLSLPPHHGFCFLSQVHVAQIQIATGREGPAAGPAGQPALQAGVWGQNQQPPAGSGRALQAAVKRHFPNLFSGLLLLCLGESRQGDGTGKQGMERECEASRVLDATRCNSREGSPW